MKYKPKRTPDRIAWQKEYDRKRYLANRDTILAKNQKYRQKNKDEIYAKNKEYYIKNSQSVKDYIKEWGSENKDKVESYKKKWRQANKEKIKDTANSDRGKYSIYRSAAKKRGYSFRLSLKEFSHLIHEDYFLCGETNAGGVDRLDNRFGYSKKNSRPCCTMCNKMKWSHDIDLFLQQVRKIHKHTHMV